MNLQGALILLVVCLLAGFLIFNWYQDYRARKQMQLPDASVDPLDVPIHPSGGPVSIQRSRAKQAPTIDGQTPRTEPSLAGIAPGRGDDAVDTMLRSATHDEQEPDMACESVIDLCFNQAMSGADLLPFIHSLRHVGSKQMHVYAKTVDDVHRAQLYEDENYISLHVAVLLANREGAITPSEWQEAVSRVNVLAEQFDGSVETPNVVDVLKQANELDRVCAGLDMQISLTLLPHDRTWESPQVVKAALDLGAVGVRHGRIVWEDNQGNSRFSLVRTDNVSLESVAPVPIAELSIILDVPRTIPESNAVARMANIAIQLADMLNAELVDDSRRPLQEGAISFIDQQLASHFQRLEQSGLRAGSERSLKVFS